MCFLSLPTELSSGTSIFLGESSLTFAISVKTAVASAPTGRVGKISCAGGALDSLTSVLCIILSFVHLLAIIFGRRPEGPPDFLFFWAWPAHTAAASSTQSPAHCQPAEEYLLPHIASSPQCDPLVNRSQVVSGTRIFDVFCREVFVHPQRCSWR